MVASPLPGDTGDIEGGWLPVKSYPTDRVRNILIPNMYYRDDIGERWAEDSDKLHNWGYLR